MHSDSKFDGLRAKLHGDLILPGSPNYDEIRKVWNGVINRHPAEIVRCAGVADVMDAVTFARDSDLLVSVR